MWSNGRKWLPGLFTAIAMIVAAFAATQGAAQTSSEGRIPTFFRWYYQFEPRGWRYWSRQDDGTWLELYETGQKSKFFDKGPSEVNGCGGLMLLKDDKSLRAFVPDDQCSDQTLLFQFMGPDGPNGPWHALGAMKNIGYEATDR